MAAKKRIIIMSESGWQGARQLSIELSRYSSLVTVLIRGRPNKDERNMITKYEKIKNIFIPQKLFAAISFIYIFYYAIFSKNLLIFITKEKTEKRVLKLRSVFNNIRIMRLREIKGHKAIFDLDMRPCNEYSNNL